MTSIFDGLTLDMGIKLVDIFGGVQIFLGQYWPIVAFAIAIPVAFGIAGKVAALGKRAGR